MADEKRLIDANAFLKSLEWECGDVCEQTEYSDYVETEYGFSRDAISQLVQKAPTVDAVEVVHGRWVSSGCGFDCCSECRKVYTDGYFTAMGIKPREQFNYCPNCGAKMDGGNEDV